MPSKKQLIKFGARMAAEGIWRHEKWLKSDGWHPLTDEVIWEIYKEVCEDV